jgi:hypothetical protein
MLAKDNSQARLAKYGVLKDAEARDIGEPASRATSDAIKKSGEEGAEGTAIEAGMDDEAVPIRTEMSWTPGSGRTLSSPDDEAFRDDLGPVDKEADHRVNRDAATEAKDAEREFMGVEGRDPGVNPAGPTMAEAPAISSTTTVIEAMEQFREKSRDMHIWLRQTYRAWMPEIGKFQGFWSEVQSLEEYRSGLMAVEHYSQLGDCRRCGGFGVVARGKPCSTCAGLGFVIAAEAGHSTGGDDSSGEVHLDDQATY